jgi:hypothetical protein
MPWNMPQLLEEAFPLIHLRAKSVPITVSLFYAWDFVNGYKPRHYVTSKSSKSMLLRPKPQPSFFSTTKACRVFSISKAW